MKFPSRYSLTLMAVVFLGLISACDSKQAAKKIYTIGVINFSPAAEPAYDGFRQGMADLGYEEGRDVRYLYQGYISDKKRLTEEGQRLMAAEVDLIFAMSTPASMVVKEITKASKTPVVFGPVSNPVASGLVASFKEPGGNLTGVSFSQQEPKRLEYLKILVPTIKRICFPYNSKDRSPNLNLKTLQTITDKLGVELVAIPLHNNDEINHFLSHFPEGFDAIYLPTDSLLATRAADFADLAIRHKIPLSPPQREGVEAGGLASYGFSIFDVGRQAARLADQVLQGIAPADLPVEQPEFVASINLSTAKKIDITIADSILRQAVVIRD